MKKVINNLFFSIVLMLLEGFFFVDNMRASKAMMLIGIPVWFAGIIMIKYLIERDPSLKKYIDLRVLVICPVIVYPLFALASNMSFLPWIYSPIFAISIVTIIALLNTKKIIIKYLEIPVGVALSIGYALFVYEIFLYGS